MGVKLTGVADIPAVLRELTKEEKAHLVTGRSSFTTYPVERLGIPSCMVLDGGTGVNFYQLLGDLYSRSEQGKQGADISGMSHFAVMMRILDNIQNPERLSEEDRKVYDIVMAELKKQMPSGDLPGCFPPGMMLGATWDPETVRLCGNAVAKEADAYQIDMVLGSPNVNIHRDPLNGRVFEGYSEDPCLTAKLGPEFVKGVQEEGLLANAKHFAANNQETHRQNVNEIISMRALYEIYFPGFKACVQEGGVKSVMDAYNKINGTACAMNKWLLTDVLRDEWGFEGMVVSDWGAAYDQAQAIAAGNDLDMPGPRDIQPILDALENGSLKIEELDLAVERVLRMLLDMPVMKGARKNTAIDRAYSRKAAYQSAAEGIVLLKNNGLLPLSKDTRLSFAGERCKLFVESGGGSAYVVTDQSTSLLEESAAKIGADKVCYNEIKSDTDVVVIAAAAQGQEGSDRPSMDLEPKDKALLLKTVQEAKAKGKKIIVVLNVAGPVDLSDYVDDVDALLCVFLPGMEGGRAAADILFGDLNPSGKLPLTFPKRYKDTPTYGNFPGCAAEVLYGEGTLVGYRYYDFKDVEPLYPFGYGLSYSTFAISGLTLSAPVMNMDKDEVITATVQVKNTSAVDGKEVVQLYVADPVSTLFKPEKELKAFQKVFLKAGEEKAVSLKLCKKDLASYDSEIGEWVSEAGEYRVLIGNSSRNICAEASFVAKGHTPYDYSERTMLETICRDGRAMDIVKNVLGGIGMDLDVLQDAITFFPHNSLEEAFGKLFVSAKLTEDEARNTFEKLIRSLSALDLSETAK